MIRGREFSSNKDIEYFLICRLCGAVAIFFFALMIFMLGVKSSRDVRSKIQNGFWFFKYLIIIGITVGLFYVNSKSISSRSFFFFFRSYILSFFSSFIVFLFFLTVAQSLYDADSLI